MVSTGKIGFQRRAGSRLRPPLVCSTLFPGGRCCALRPSASPTVGRWRRAIRTWGGGQTRVRALRATPPKRPSPVIAIPRASRSPCRAIGRGGVRWLSSAAPAAFVSGAGVEISPPVGPERHRPPFGWDGRSSRGGSPGALLGWSAARARERERAGGVLVLHKRQDDVTGTQG